MQFTRFKLNASQNVVDEASLQLATYGQVVFKVICRWLKEADGKTLFIAKGRPWENGYFDSFNGKFRDERLKREIFLSFEEACWVIDRWRLDYNHHRIHSSLDYQTPAAYAAGCVLPASATPQPPEHTRFTNPNPLTQPGAKTGGWSSTFASSSVSKISLLSSSLLSLPLNDPIKPFSQGLALAMKSVLTSACFSQRQITLDTNSGPLSVVNAAATDNCQF